MIEESFVRLYAHDFRQFAARAEMGQEVEPRLSKRLDEARKHCALMTQRKGADYRAALVARLREEASRFNDRAMLKDADPQQAAKRHRQFLGRIADLLARPAGKEPSMLPSASPSPSAPVGTGASASA